jgi:RNA polymerase sigma-70 factor (ECF subfamily)
MVAGKASGDADLVRRARRGDVEAFGEIVERHQNHLYNAAYHLLGSEEDAEDVAQEAFVRAFRALENFEGRAKFSTWLYGIMVNCVRNIWRRHGRRPVIHNLGDYAGGEEGRSFDPPGEGGNPVDAYMREERVDAVRAAIASLSEDMREVIVLRDIEGLTYEEMADAIGAPEGTVKSRLHRARMALKERLEPLHGQI